MFLAILSIDAHGLNALAYLIVSDYLDFGLLVKGAEFLSEEHDLLVRFSRQAALEVVFGHLGVAEDIDVLVQKVVVVSLTHVTEMALLTRWLRKRSLRRRQVLDVVLAQLEHFLKSLVLLAFEHVLAIVEDVVAVLRWRLPMIYSVVHLMSGVLAPASPVEVQASEFDARDASGWRQVRAGSGISLVDVFTHFLFLNINLYKVNCKIKLFVYL